MTVPTNHSSTDHVQTIEITSRDQVKLDPFRLGVCVQGLSWLVLLLVGLVYLVMVMAIVPLCPITTLPNVAALIFIILLPLYTALFLSALNHVGLRDSESLERSPRLGDWAGSNSALIDAIERILRADVRRVTPGARVRLVFRQTGSPYTFRFFFEHRIVVSTHWIQSTLDAADTESEALRDIRAVLLHELGHIRNRDFLFMSVTGMTLALATLAIVSGVVWKSWTMGDCVRPVLFLLVCIIARLYVTRRREAFADMTAVKFLQAYTPIERQIRNATGSSTPLHVHGFVGFLQSGFVSEAHKRTWRHRVFSALAWVFGSYFDSHRRLRFLRDGLGQFATIGKRDFFLMGIIRAVVPVLAGAVCLQMGLHSPVQLIATYAFVVGLVTYLICRMSMGYTLVARPENIVWPWRRVRYYWLGIIAVYLPLFTVILATAVPTTPALESSPFPGWFYLGLGILLESLWAAALFRAYIQNHQRVGYIMEVDKVFSVLKLTAWFCALANATCFVVLGLFDHYFGASLPIPWMVMIFVCVSVIPFKISTKFISGQHGFTLKVFNGRLTDRGTWDCPACHNKNDVETVTGVGGVHLDPLGVMRACGHCRRLALEEFSIVLTNEGHRIQAGT